MRSFYLLFLILSTWIVGFSCSVNAQVKPIKPNREAGQLALPPLVKADTAKTSNPAGLFADSAGIAMDTSQSKSIQTKAPKSSGSLESQVDYKAKDSVIISVKNNVAYLYNLGEVYYQDISIKSGYIQINWKTNEVIAHGITDSTGKVVQKPIFSEAGKDYQTDTIRYNFDSKKAKIKKIITQEGEGFLHGEDVKKIDDQVFYIKNAAFTTCSHEHPHFRIITSRTKVITGKQLVAGPSYLEILDIPTPLVVPFGFFPTVDKKKSGILIPAYETNAARGYGLRGLGFYWAASPYFDYTVRTDFYTQGGFAVYNNFNYSRRYKYRGNLDLNFNRIIIGKPSFEEYGQYQNSRDLGISWRHTQDPKANPNLNFSASVNIVSNNFFQTSTTDANLVLTNTLNSSISLNKLFPNKPFSLSIAATHNQNTQTGVMNVSLPTAVFNVQRLQPFRKKVFTGKSSWYEEIGINYSANFRNEASFVLDSLNGSADILQELFLRSNNGMSHTLPIAANYRVFKHFTFTPSVNYRSNWYFRRYDYNWNSELNTLETDTIQGFYMLNDVSARADVSTKLYGMFRYKYGPVKAMRHVLTPRIGVSYTPDFSSPNWAAFGGNVYQSVQVDSTGAKEQKNRFERIALYGVPGNNTQGNVNFGIDNQVEMKIKSKKDTSGLRKLPLLEGLGINGSYNMAAERFQWSTINFNARTTLLNGLININYVTSFDPYAADSAGRRIEEFNYKVNGRLLRPLSTTLNLGTRINSAMLAFLFGNKENIEVPETAENESEIQNEQASSGITDGDINYLLMKNRVDFSSTWDLNIDYFLRFDPATEINPARTTQTLNFNGNITLTENWRIGFNSGYDIKEGQFTYTTLDFSRNLHCWDLTFRWVPFGFQKSYFFSIGVRAPMLRDLKLDRRRGIGEFGRVL